jgi:DNA-binding transcriptional ArsR family regulator
MKRLPSIKAMQALEALERLGTAQAVADEMGLTRSAVSHILRRLETDAGFALSEPDGRGQKLTVRGRHYALEARRALAILKDAASHERVPMAGELKVVCPPGFASLWLAGPYWRVSGAVSGCAAEGIGGAAARRHGRRGCGRAGGVFRRDDDARQGGVAGAGQAVSGLRAIGAVGRTRASQGIGPGPFSAAASCDRGRLAALAGGSGRGVCRCRERGRCFQTCRWCSWQQQRGRGWRWEIH